MNKECIDKTGPIYCCICPLSKRQSVTWLASPLTDGLVYLYTGQFYHTKLYLLQVASSTTPSSTFYKLQVLPHRAVSLALHCVTDGG